MKRSAAASWGRPPLRGQDALATADKVPTLLKAAEPISNGLKKINFV
jgi:hypothetical protein